MVNDIDVLKRLGPSNITIADGSVINSDTIATLVGDVARIRNSLRGRNGLITRLERLESGIPANATFPITPTDRSRYSMLTRRIATLEQKVANLTERLSRDHCKSYPCQNGGSCFNMFDTFRCECPGNWEGPTCSVDIDECSKYAGTDLGCQNGATCINSFGSFQ